MLYTNVPEEEEDTMKAETKENKEEEESEPKRVHRHLYEI